MTDGYLTLEQKKEILKQTGLKMLNETVGIRWYKILELNTSIALPSIISTTNIANTSI